MENQSISEASLKAAITERLNAVHVTITDMSGQFMRASLFLEKIRSFFVANVGTHTGGCGQAFSTLIVSPDFAGKNSLKRHRLVNSALKEEIAAIHAWTAKCQTPEEWQKGQAAAGSKEPSMEGTVDGKVEGTAA